MEHQLKEETHQWVECLEVVAECLVEVVEWVLVQALPPCDK
jgi:hypothetical protein